jgi:predicted glycogen debranching enzyme
MKTEPKTLGLERSLDLEWILTNNLGGYCSSTVLELNTRKYHGLLVPAVEGLNRMVCLQKLEDSIESAGGKTDLHCIEFKNLLLTPGFNTLKEFRRGLDDVCLVHDCSEFTLEKSIKMPHGRNSIVVSYKLSNKSRNRLKHCVTPHVNFRGIHELSREGGFSVNASVMDGKAVVQLDRHTLTFKPSEGSITPENIWMKDVYYRKEAERGYDSTEDSFIPMRFEFQVEAECVRNFSIVVSLDDDNVSEQDKWVSSVYNLKDFDMAVNSANSFIINSGKEKTIIAGYHWFGEWGRDAMISLPGLTLVNGRLDDARMILERFLSRVKEGRVMTESESGNPAYRDFDSTLWLIDRIKEYIKYVGSRQGTLFLRQHWPKIEEIMRYYEGLQQDGIIKHNSGTWMDTLERDNAVEIQALWLNALNTVSRFCKLAGFKPSINLEESIKDFETSFIEKYWNGSILRDCLKDDSLRPNQLIALSLDYNCIGVKEAQSILKCIDEKLLTPYGLRTLSPDDSRFKGQYTGNASEREQAYHNGTVWPWLIGPYLTASRKNRPTQAKKYLDNFFQQALRMQAQGSINEIYDGNQPHTPRGCVAQAWSTAEPLRVYIQDIVGQKPPYENLFR